MARDAQEWERQIRKPLKVALRVARLRDRHPDVFVSVFFMHQEALERYLDIAAGFTDYIRFQRWLVFRLPFYLLGHAMRKMRDSALSG